MTANLQRNTIPNELEVRCACHDSDFLIVLRIWMGVYTLRRKIEKQVSKILLEVSFYDE
jgi:hypothetical protein